jgi:hypothetical protein
MTIMNHGWNLLPVFFGDMKAMTWPGQFNLDFMTFLILTGVWLAWRHRFSAKGLLYGLLGLFGGMLFLAPYLLITSYQVNGDMTKLFMGDRM